MGDGSIKFMLDLSDAGGVSDNIRHYARNFFRGLSEGNLQKSLKQLETRLAAENGDADAVRTAVLEEANGLFPMLHRRKDRQGVYIRLTLSSLTEVYRALNLKTLTNCTTADAAPPKPDPQF